MRYGYRRGSLWLILYFVIAIFPIAIGYWGRLPDYRGFLLETGVVLGFLGLSISGLQFLFSGRFIKIAPAIGVDNIIQFHKELGIIGVLFCLSHPVILIIADPTYISYFDPSVNLPRALALSAVSIGMLLLIATSLWRLSFGMSYEFWRLGHGILGFLLIFVGITHSFQVSHYMEPLWKKILFAVFFGSLAYLLALTRLIRPYKNKKKPYIITGVEEERDDCYVLSLSPQNHERLSFYPGQFVWITIRNSPFSLQQHPFSISSSADSPTIKLTAKALGDFTSSWKKLKTGNKAFLEGPFGSFTLKEKPCCFIMGGIGITPGISILETLNDRNDKRQCILIYGNMEWEKIPFREKLESLEANMNLKVVHVLEEPDEDWKGEKGLISPEILEKHLPENPDAFDYYICGPAPMMDIAEMTLRNKGIDWRNIYAERFEMV